MKKIVILGSTGSIGTQALEVIETLDNYEILALAAHSSVELMEQQILKFDPHCAVMADKDAAQKLKEKLRVQQSSVEVIGGLSALENLASDKNADLVLNALVGAVGLKPSLACIEAGNQLALANKESMVIGGELINKKLAENNQQILPVDSEHNAVFQLLEGNENKKVERIYLTASGGPFLNYSRQELQNVSVGEALNHPNWDMGPKITIDSATMMNKGLEVIEAHYLFGNPFTEIKIIIHPESIIHSMVEFVDGSIHAEMGPSDMKLPIQYVLTYPETEVCRGSRLDLLAGENFNLNLQKPDRERFPAIDLAYQAGKQGGTMPVVLNAANEVVVNAFLEGRIAFDEITDIISRVMDRHDGDKNSVSLDNIIAADQWARSEAEEVF